MKPITGIHIEPTNICTLKCPGCSRTRFIQQWPQHWKNHNLEIASLMNFLDIDISGLLINFCGNYGDPIYHPNFIQMVREIKNRNAIVNIDTNGSYKQKSWWAELCSLLDEKDQIRFGVDGLPYSFTKYRINADWTSIHTGMETCQEYDIKTVWKFIPFSFNQHEIDDARSLAQEIGITEFLVDPSDRYDEQTSHLTPAVDLIGYRKTSQDLAKANIDQAVSPKCKSGKEHFIAATGHYSPCCFIADHRFYYKTDFGKNKELYNINNTTLSRLLAQETVIDFFDKISSTPPLVCQFNCPKR